MIQNILVAIILIAVAVYVIYAAVRFFSGGKKKQSMCDGCSGCDLSNQLKNNCAPPENGNNIKNNEE